MNVARSHHSSCSLATALYVFCGVNNQWGHLNSVEKLNTTNLVAGWLLIQIPPTSLTPREYPVVAALNATQILIMGGENGGRLGDVLTFDTRDNSVRMVIEEGPLKPSKIGTTPVHVRPDTVVALVTDPKSKRKRI